MDGDGDLRCRRANAVLWRRTLNGIVVLGPEAEEPVQITGSGSDIWALLSEPRTAEEIVDRLVKRYGEDEEGVRVDTAAVLERLLEAGVVERRP